jgi:hypothetical protein
MRFKPFQYTSILLKVVSVPTSTSPQLLSWWWSLLPCWRWSNFPKGAVIHFLSSDSISEYSPFNFQPNGPPGCPVRCPPHPLLCFFSWASAECVCCFFLNVLTFRSPYHCFWAADNFWQDPTLSWVHFFTHWRRWTTKHSRSSYRSTAASVASRIASTSMASILTKLPP